MAKTGRPTKYNDRLTMLAAQLLAEKGLTDAQISERLEITEATLCNWKKSYPDFFESLKAGKAGPDDQVEASLFKRAIGYDNPNAVKIFMPQGAKEPVYASYTEHYAPDTTAQIFWLKNRRPDRWRDKQELAVDSTVEIKHTFDPEGV